MESTDLSPGYTFKSNDSGMAVKISTEVMVAAIAFLFLVVTFVFFLYLYAKNYWGRSITARRRFIFAAGHAPISSCGLDAAVLRSLPVTVIKQGDFKDGLECSVCLCELSLGEEARLLPKCSHGFHLECIDMWFHSHSTCPLCRCPVGPEPAVSSFEVPRPTAAGTADAETTSEDPTNVLFWGNRDRVNTSVSVHSERRLVISIPNRSVEGFLSPISPLPSSRFPVEIMKSPAEEARSPGTSKFRSLRRLLSRGKRTDGSACSSPMGGDIEQGLMRCGAANGEGSSNVPKTPTISELRC